MEKRRVILSYVERSSCVCKYRGFYWAWNLQKFSDSWETEKTHVTHGKTEIMRTRSGDRSYLVGHASLVGVEWSLLMEIQHFAPTCTYKICHWCLSVRVWLASACTRNTSSSGLILPKSSSWCLVDQKLWSGVRVFPPAVKPSLSRPVLLHSIATCLQFNAFGRHVGPLVVRNRSDFSTVPS